MGLPLVTEKGLTNATGLPCVSENVTFLSNILHQECLSSYIAVIDLSSQDLFKPNGTYFIFSTYYLFVELSSH